MISKSSIFLPIIFLSIPSSYGTSAFQVFPKPNLHSTTYPPPTSKSDLPPSPFSIHTQKKHKHKQTSSLCTAPTSRGGETNTPTLPQKLLAESIGTFLIVHLGCGTVCAAIYQSAQVGLWQIAAVWSLAVSLAIYTTGHISGAHLNPAITIAMKLCRPSVHTAQTFSWGTVGKYCTAQLVGAIMAAGVNLSLYWESIKTFEATKGILRGASESVASAAAFGEYWSVGSWKQAFLAEGVGTFILSFLIFALTNDRNQGVPKGAIPVLIGATVGCLISVIAPLTQAGFNPARDFGPRVVAWLAGWGRDVAMKGCWVYVLAPIVGAVLGGFMAEKLLGGEED